MRGIPGFLIDNTTNTFKFTDHGWEKGLEFYDENREAITPDTIDLVNGEITWAAWDGEAEVFADFEATGINPVDALRLLLTDDTRGAGIPLASLDTASSGKGFGTNGARREYIYGEELLTGDDAITLPIGLYIDDADPVEDFIKEVVAHAFAIFYIDRAGLYQVKAWEPVVSEGLSVLNTSKIQSVNSNTNATKPFTRVVARYGRNVGFDDTQTRTVADDELRQLRGLAEHATLDAEIPIATRFGAIEWAEKTLAIRGRPQRTFTIRTIQEFMQFEPGDFIRLLYPTNNIDEALEVLSINTKPGSLEVTLTCTDTRSWRDRPGFWTADSPAFPASLGGSTITAWDDTWSDAQVDWARENNGFWLDDDGYADVTDDPLRSFGGSQWF